MRPDTGSDDNPGTVSAPVQTMAKVQELFNQYRSNYSRIVVNLQPGTYPTYNCILQGTGLTELFVHGSAGITVPSTAFLTVTRCRYAIFDSMYITASTGPSFYTIGVSDCPFTYINPPYESNICWAVSGLVYISTENSSSSVTNCTFRNRNEYEGSVLVVTGKGSTYSNCTFGADSRSMYDLTIKSGMSVTYSNCTFYGNYIEAQTGTIPT